tara:strand:+ start:500 stop:688 length:189 start_codon:yes stop_codon:yes gene_type:complete
VIYLASKATPTHSGAAIADTTRVGLMFTISIPIKIVKDSVKCTTTNQPIQEALLEKKFTFLI